MNNKNNNGIGLLEILTVLSFCMQLDNVDLDKISDEKIIGYMTKETTRIIMQNEIIIAQNEEILRLLKKEATDNAQENDKRDN